MRATRQGRILIDFEAGPGPVSGGGAGVNRLCAEALRRGFDAVDSAAEADLRVRSFNWDAPPRPPRLFIDHGSFADAGFWAYTAPKLSAGDTILVASSVCVEVAARFIRSDGPVIRRVPFPIRLDLFKPLVDRSAARRWLEAHHGVPGDGPLLLVVSAFVRRKNQHLAVLFHRTLLEEVPGARLAFAGGSPGTAACDDYHEAVRDLAARAGADDRVHFLGQVAHDRLPRVMAASDLLVHLTNCRLENFGLVVAEAMAAGLPVVAADWGGLRDLVLPGETGILAATYLTSQGPRTDWRSAVGPAAELLRDREAWTRMSRNSRILAERHLSPETFQDRLRQTVTAALERKVAGHGPLALTDEGTDLMFRTITLNARHPEIRSTGEEYRLLLPLDHGRHYRWLTGPAASSDRAPAVTAGDRLYAVATWSTEGDDIRITDPAWPAVLAAGPMERDLAWCCDGSRTLDAIMRSLSIEEGQRAAVVRAAQSLVDRGVLCPAGRLQNGRTIRDRAGSAVRDVPDP